MSKEEMGVLVLLEPLPMLFPLSAEQVVGEAVGSVKGVPRAGEGMLDDVAVDGSGLISGRPAGLSLTSSNDKPSTKSASSLLSLVVAWALIPAPTFW